MLSIFGCHCESRHRRTKQSVHSETILLSKPLFIIFLLSILPFISFNNLYSQTLQTNPDSIPFAPAVDYATGDAPYSIFCADLDTVLGLDLATADAYSGGTVSILKNNGNGTFQTKDNYTVGAYAYSVFCANLDEDSDIDIAVAIGGTVPNFIGSVSILENDGNGTFQIVGNYNTGTGSVSVFSANLDGDSDLDLALANLYGDNVSILKSNGDGTFQTKLTTVQATVLFPFFVQI